MNANHNQKRRFSVKKDITELKRRELLKELFPEEVIKKKNIFQIMIDK